MFSTNLPGIYIKLTSLQFLGLWIPFFLGIHLPLSLPIQEGKKDEEQWRWKSTNLPPEVITQLVPWMGWSWPNAK